MLSSMWLTAASYGAKAMLAVQVFWGKVLLFIAPSPSPSPKKGTFDIEKLLSEEGAAKTGGSLEGASKLVDSYGQGGFTIGRKIAFWVAAFCVIGVAIGLMMHGGNSNKLSETKSSIVPKVIGILLLFGVAGVLIFFQSMGADLFSF